MASVPPAPESTPGEKKGGIPAWMLVPILIVVIVVVMVFVPTGKGPVEKEKEKPVPQEPAK